MTQRLQPRDHHSVYIDGSRTAVTVEWPIAQNYPGGVPPAPPPVAWTKEPRINTKRRWKQFSPRHLSRRLCRLMIVRKSKASSNVCWLKYAANRTVFYRSLAAEGRIIQYCWCGWTCCARCSDCELSRSARWSYGRISWAPGTQSNLIPVFDHRD